MRKKNVAVLISGGGSNLQSLINAALVDEYPAQICLVISNVERAGGLKRAEDAGIAHVVINHKNYDTREQFEQVMHHLLVEKEIELVCLAGFMRILSDGFVRQWEGKILNIHPSLLPKYRGLHTHLRALEAGDGHAGCTVHWVVPELDAGPIIAQEKVPILAGDTVEKLAARVLKKEHLIYPAALRDVALGLV